jgi:hypothetical protein
VDPERPVNATAYLNAAALRPATVPAAAAAPKYRADSDDDVHVRVAATADPGRTSETQASLRALTGLGSFKSLL